MFFYLCYRLSVNKVLCMCLYTVNSVFAVSPLELFGISSMSDHIEFSGDFRLCSPEDDDDDEDCDVISGSGEVDGTVTPRSTDSDGGPATSSTDERHRVYVERTSAQPHVTSKVEGTSTGGDSLVVVVDMTERSPSRHAGRPVTPTVRPSQPFTAGRPPSYRLVTSTPASLEVAGGGSAVAERVALNVGLIVGIVGAVSTLVVMLAALLLCRPRPNVAQSLAAAADVVDVDVDVVDNQKLKLSNGDSELHGVRHNVMSLGLDHRPTRFQSAGTRLSTADEWFV